MWNSIGELVNIRATISWSLSTVLFLSLMCSLSMQHGHADTPIAVTADEIRPLQVGQSAPRFTVQTVDHKPFEFDPQSLERPVLLISFRGGWCPFCNMYLSELRNVIDEVDALGVDVLFLSGDRPELLYRSLSQETQEDIANLNYRILSDADAQATIAFGTAFKASQKTFDWLNENDKDIIKSSMLQHGVLPVPSVFAVDKGGIIAFQYANPDYKVRMPTEELLQVAAEIAAAK